MKKFIAIWYCCMLPLVTSVCELGNDLTALTWSHRSEQIAVYWGKLGAQLETVYEKIDKRAASPPKA